MGNEYSSNFPNTVYQGFPINHQYCKTIDFCQKINEYLHRFITADYHYFSPFFGLYEYKIASYFFKAADYLDIWTSCNHQDGPRSFCSACYKCAFIYLLSLAYVEESFLSNSFSHNMLEDLELYKPIIDFTAEKPLDCVGEKKEAWVILAKLMQHPKHKESNTVKYFKI